jgi:hypothetical protein
VTAAATAGPTCPVRPVGCRQCHRSSEAVRRNSGKGRLACAAPRRDIQKGWSDQLRRTTLTGPTRAALGRSFVSATFLIGNGATGGSSTTSASSASGSAERAALGQLLFVGSSSAITGTTASWTAGLRLVVALDAHGGGHGRDDLLLGLRLAAAFTAANLAVRSETLEELTALQERLDRLKAGLRDLLDQAGDINRPGGRTRPPGS